MNISSFETFFVFDNIQLLLIFLVRIFRLLLVFVSLRYAVEAFLFSIQIEALVIYREDAAMSSYLKWLFRSSIGGNNHENVGDRVNHSHNHPFNIPDYLLPTKPRSRSLDTKALEATGVKWLQQVRLESGLCGTY